MDGSMLHNEQARLLSKRSVKILVWHEMYFFVWIAEYRGQCWE